VNPNSNKVANLYNNIGLVYREQQRYSQAFTMFEKCLKIQLEVLSSNHSGIATSLNNISQAYSSNDDYEKTIDYLNQFTTSKSSRFS
jgi:tetratricopeptide (TPR) repeat protein